jgi:hypothetical protein
MEREKRSIANTPGYLIFMSRLLLANRGMCGGQVLDHLLSQKCRRIERCRSVIVYRALYRQ